MSKEAWLSSYEHSEESSRMADHDPTYQRTRYAQHGTAFCLPSEGAPVAVLADHLAILADSLLAHGSRQNIRIAGDMAAWIDAARSSEWWGWRTPLSLIRAPLTVEDFRRIEEVTRGRIAR